MNSHDLGVVDYVTELGLDKAFELAEEISSGGERFVCIPDLRYLIGFAAPLALRAAKLAISNASDLSLEAGLDFERACYQPLLFTKDRLEALSAFQEKRTPVFKGE